MSGSPLATLSLITFTTPLDQMLRTRVCLDKRSPEVGDIHKVLPEGAKICIYVLDTQCGQQRKYQESHVLSRHCQTLTDTLTSHLSPLSIRR